MTEIENRLNKFTQLKTDFPHLYTEKCPSVNTSCLQIIAEFKDLSRDEIHASEVASQLFNLTGRIMSIRNKGNAIFINIMQEHGEIQCFFKKSFLAQEADFAAMKLLDIGDYIHVAGQITRTKVGELTIKVSGFSLLAKCYQVMYDKHHKLKDPEIRYRKRYIDFIANKKSYQTIMERSKIITAIRKYLDNLGFLEVETPILHSILGGAAALPFITKHNSLKQNFYLRIATELHLKRLVVGGLHKVYEIGRIFRNEGIDKTHSPEFTSIELYEAFADMNKIMQLTENLFSHLVSMFHSNQELTYDNVKLNFQVPFERYTMQEAVLKFCQIDFNKIATLEDAKKIAHENGITVLPYQNDKYTILYLLYEKCVEHQIMQPTFISLFPTSVSPLARKNADNPLFADRFELVIKGNEYANAFSELTDPFDQQERFEDQLIKKQQGDDEACELDDNYIDALRCGLVPTGGLGIGIDRLIMLLTNQINIREVIAFPALKKY